MEQLQKLEAEYKVQIEKAKTEIDQYNALKAEKTQNSNILSALQNELTDHLQNAGNIFSNKDKPLSVEEYLDIRNGSSGIKARIEYYEAYGEELDKKLYEQGENAYKENQKLREIRKNICGIKGYLHLNSFIKQHSAELSEILMYFSYSGDFEPTQYDETTREQKAFSAMQKRIFQHLTPKPISKELASLALDFTPKSVMTKHKESFNKEAKGFDKLLNNLT